MLGQNKKKKYEKNYLCFNFFVLSYYLYIELGQIPRHIYRYMDIEIGGGADSGGADGAERWG